MNSIRCGCVVKVYEVDGKEVPILSTKCMRTRSHWNRSEFITLIYENQEFTVRAVDLVKAIRNCTNV